MNTEDCIVETSEKTQVDNEIVGQASRDDLMANDPARDDLLILVDGRDREIGTATKLQAHVEGTLHRAFSVVLLRDGAEGPELLLAKRSMAKYHSGGLWANSCCSHPRVGEETIEAAYRRVREELGCDAVDLREIAAFVYRAEFDNGLCEHEFDHVFVGWLGKDKLDKEPMPNPEEASQMEFVDVEEIMNDVLKNPGKYAAWFMPALLIATDGEEYGSMNKEVTDRIIY